MTIFCDWIWENHLPRTIRNILKNYLKHCISGSHEVAGKGYINIENSQLASIGAIFTSTYYTKQQIHGQTHHSVMWWITACCLLIKGRWSHLKIILAWTSDKLQQKQPGKLSTLIPPWIVRWCVQLSFDGEKRVLLLGAWKAAFLKSSHIAIGIIL